MFKYFLDPFNVFWILFFTSIIFLFLKKVRIFRIFFILSVLGFIISSNFIIPDILLSGLEEQYNPCCIEKIYNDTSRYNIIVLGAGFTDDERLPPTERLSSTALLRLIEGIRIHRLLRNSYLIMSGPAIKEGYITQAEVFRQAAYELGVDPARIFIQGTPANTYEEAEAYYNVFRDSTPLILVTSASHMPRAVMTFSKPEMDIIPAPANFRIKKGELNTRSWLPSSSNMEKMKTALIEYVGIWWYGIKYQ